MDKRYDHSSAEQAVQKKWLDEKTYSIKDATKPFFSVDTPPPTVSGSLHIGHIFSYVQTDIVARFRRMCGLSVFYPLGFDDNGLATEKFVEKKLKVTAGAMPRSEFIALCLQETERSRAEFKQLWQRIGLSVDWHYSYSTISAESRRLSQESFVELYKKGYIYRKNEPALYCISCRTSVAQAELDDVEKESFFNDIVFKDQKGNNLIIGTTRPELLSSCVALLYNPNDERYVHLKGQQATVPLFGIQVPIYEDEAVSIEKGTGLVMCCTFGDKTDIEWYKKFKLPYRQSIGLDGKWASDTGILAGLKGDEARTVVLEALKEQGLLVAQRIVSRPVNVHERCKKEIEYVALPQWFLRILDKKEKFLALADTINWYPSFMKSRYSNWVENLNWDWCLSRQRFYGVPFPVWHCVSCKEIIVANEQQLPVDPREVTYNGVCPSCKGTDIVPDTDVMDTWNTSSITPQLCYALYAKNERPSLHDKEIASFIPMSMRPQAHDIIRTWAFYTIIKSYMHHNTIPWRDIVISGHVLSSAQEKLSKSKNNAALSPEYLLQQYPADAIRYWTASARLGHDVAFSEGQLKIGIKLLTKLWNAFLFIKEHCAEVSSSKPFEGSLGTINEWLVHEATVCFASYQRHLQGHEFSLALQEVESFFWGIFCDTYLELIKDQFFNSDQYDIQQIKATQWTLYTVGLRILQMYAPYVPHITEVLYKELYQIKEHNESLHLVSFDAVQVPYVFESSVYKAQIILALLSAVRKLKTEKQLSLKTEVEKLVVFGQSEDLLAVIQEHEQLVRGSTKGQLIVYKIGAKEPALEMVDGLWHMQVTLTKD